ncbi:putative fatty acid synthase [Cavenderia fasciculata]|uniref:Fatty acid synthase n=1 Tax=Cavenderia fasciculata TaxID=261658 RepID=F4QD72_CACFS|nr:putative fatty acid synthase [Cavenderia fasciculata]EGG14543.1 putative fatty acid synthase [Cavenderia fasciculata]|eukprot:XP_004366063.1 putative fatty acid synthase [Cavenderia fasciculata]
MDIAIIGIGLRFPGGSKTPDEFWDHLINKKDGISEAPKERYSPSFYDQGFISNKYGGFIEEDEWKRFDPLFFGISPKETTYLDPQQRVLQTCMWEALEDAHIQPQKIRGSKTGVYLGLMNQDYQKQQHRDILDMSPYLVTGNGNCFYSNRLSFCFDLRGPSITLDTACSSSLNAIFLGMQGIRSGDCDMAVAGGVNALYDPTITINFSSLNMLSHKGRCSSFDEGADGFVRSEGAGLVILKRLDKAIEDGDRIYCVLKGGSSNVDGSNNKTTITAPSSHAQAENIVHALNNSRVDAKDVFYFEAHGTGTPVGDPVEVEALSTIFAQNHSPSEPLHIGSVKSNIGHLESAAGVASLIKCCLMLKNRQLAPNIHFNKVNPKIKLNEWNIKVVTENESFPTDKLIRMGVGSFGLGGSNCHLIMEEYKSDNNNNTNSSYPSSSSLVIPFSANSKLSLDKYVNSIVNNVNRVELNDFAKYQVFTKANIIASRKIIVANSWEELVSQKKSYSVNKSLTSNIAALGIQPKIPVVFVFCGQGPQWKGMGQVLYHSQPVFKQAVDRADDLLKTYFGYSILAQLQSLPSDNSPELHHPKLAQPSIFLLQFGLTELYKQWNIKPSIVIGHSFGEVTAAYYANIISLECAAKIVYYRSTLQNLTIGSGKMLSIGISAEQYNTDYAPKYPTLEIACYNSNDSIVITGVESDLQVAAEDMKESNVFTAFLTTPCSFHSSHQEKIKQQLFDSPLIDLEYTDGEMIPFFSTIHGGLLKTKQEYSIQYIYDNLREPVAFTKAIANIFTYISDNQLGMSPVFLEIAPHSTLAFYIKKLTPTVSNDDESAATPFTPLVLSPLNRKKNELESFHGALGELYCHGLNIDFGQQFQHEDIVSYKERTTSIPRYQWDTELYWDEPLVSQKIRLRGPTSSILGHPLNSGSSVYEALINVNAESYQFLKGHKVKGKFLFPGSGYIDNILSSHAGLDVAIHNLEFNTPFFLTEGVLHHLQTSIIQNSKNEFKVEFTFCDGNQTEKWTKSAHGRISTYSPSTPPKVDLESIKQTCQLATLSKDEVYGKLQTLGLPYGPTFQRISSFSFGLDCSLSQLEMHPTSKFDKDRLLNASILDCCLHGLLALMDGPQELVFERLENLKFYSSSVPDSNSRPQKVYVYSKSTKIAGNSSHGSIDMILEDGTLLLSIGRVVSTSLTKVKRTVTVKHPSKELYKPIWQSKQSVLSTPILQLNNHVAPLTLEEDIRLNQYISLLVNQLDESSNDLSGQSKVLERLLNIAKETKVSTDQSQSSVEKLKAELSTKYPSNVRDLKLVTKSIKSFIPQVSNAADAAAVDNVQRTQEQVDDGYSLLESLFYLLASSKEVESVLVQHFKSTFVSLLQSPRVVRLLDIGIEDDKKRSITISLIKQIASLIRETKSESTIDYTIVVSSETKSILEQSIKKVIPDLPDNLVIKYRTTLSLEEDFIEQNLLTCSFDFVISSFAFTANANAGKLSQQINKVLLPKGQLIALEPPKESVIFDLVAGNYPKIVYDNFGQDQDRVNNDASTLGGGEWSRLLSARGGFETVTFYQSQPHHPSLIVGQKHGIVKSLSLSSSSSSSSSSIDKIIFIITKQSEKVQDFISQANSKFDQVHTFDSTDLLDSQDNNKQEQFVGLIEQGENVVVFVGLEQMTVETYRRHTYEFVKVNQLMLKSQANKTKLLLLTLNAQKEATNYLSSSLVGIYRYFLEQQHILDTCSIDVDQQTLSTIQIKDLLNLLDQVESLGEKEFVLRSGTSDSTFVTLVQRYQRVPQWLSHKSSVESNPNNIVFKLDSNLNYAPHPRENILGDNQVEIKVMATGLNYKDNLFYRGLLPQEIFSKGDIYNPPFGLECSGIVSRVGSKVTNFVVGDEVVGFSSHSFSSHTITSQDRIVKKPSNISFVEAAAIPVVYATAYYSIFHIGHFIPSQESILIHSATGGVGIAALNLLKYKKHTGPVFATSGGSLTGDKVQILHDRYGSLLTAVLSTANNVVGKGYADQLRTFPGTKEGVDLVLNTLSGDFLKPNFDSLSPIGRIMDLSVTQLMENDNIDIEVFKYHVGYQTIDLERAIAYSPNIVNGILVEVFEAISKGLLDSIPVESFPVVDTKRAIEYINERKHVGKIVVDFSEFDKDIAAPLVQQHKQIVVKPNYSIDGLQDTLLITGQTGIAVLILRWILEHAPDTLKHVIVLSRSALKWELQLLINQQKQKNGGKGVSITYRSCDVSRLDSLRSTVQAIYAADPSIAPVKSVIHFATIYDYCQVDDISQKTIDATHEPKTVGAVNLHSLGLELGWSLVHFVLFSSIVSVLGSTNQASYTSANLVLDSLAQFRRQQGLAATSINWGALDAGGEVAKDKSVAQFLKSRGVNLVSLAKILGGLGGVLSCTSATASPSQVMLTNFAYRPLFEYCQQIRPKLEHLAPDTDLETKSSASSGADSKSGGNSVADRVVAVVSELLSIHPSKLNMDTRLKDYGIDSLLTVQLKNWLDQEFTKNLFTHLQLSSNSINSIIQKINAKSTTTTTTTTSSSSNASSSKDILKKIEVKNTTTNSIGKPIEFWQKEAKLDSSLTPSSNLKKCKSYNNGAEKINVLLTGASGYLGIYLLYSYLVSDSVDKIYCIIRSQPDETRALQFLANKLQSLHLVVDSSVFDSRVVALVGDLSHKSLGLGEDRFAQLANQVDLIVSNGANVNFLETYDEIQVTNVNCTKELIRLSILGDYQKRIVHISSISVFFNDKRDSTITEHSFPSFDHLNEMNGYIQSKVITEYLVRDAARRGIPASIMRVGPIFADSRTGIDNDNDILSTVVKAIFELGAYPSFNLARGEGSLNTSPIDWVSLATAKLSLHEPYWSSSSSSSSSDLQEPNIFHIINQDSSSVDGKMNSLLDICHVINTKYPLQEINDYVQWRNLLFSTKNLAACNKIKLFFHDTTTFPLFHIGFGDCSLTTNQLSLINISKCEITKDTIIKNIEYYKSKMNIQK